MHSPHADFVPITSDDVRGILEDPSKLSLVAQPIIDIKRAVVAGYEILARFALGRPAPPDQVFAAAVNNGLGEPLEALVVGRAIELARTRPANCFVTINIDPLHLLAPAVQAVLAAHASYRGVVFEMTEQHTMHDLRAMRRALDGLRTKGALIAIDDAGAGYSGLKQILELQPQLLKVDRDLVTAIHQNEAKRALVQMLGELAGRLDAWLLAEGIEDEDECNALYQLGVPLLQGYFLGRPAPPWAPIEPKAQKFLTGLRRTELAARLCIEHVMERCFIVGEGETWPDRAKIAVRVDATHRPLELRLLGEDGAKVRTSPEMLRVKRDALLPEVALRAATRPERHRWEPLLVIDERGNLEGVVPMQRLVSAIAADRAPDRTGERDSAPVSSSAFAAEPTRH